MSQWQASYLADGDCFAARAAYPSRPHLRHGYSKPSADGAHPSSASPVFGYLDDLPQSAHLDAQGQVDARECGARDDTELGEHVGR